jgi:hypothetical protein
MIKKIQINRRTYIYVEPETCREYKILKKRLKNVCFRMKRIKNNPDCIKDKSVAENYVILYNMLIKHLREEDKLLTLY